MIRYSAMTATARTRSTATRRRVFCAGARRDNGRRSGRGSFSPTPATAGHAPSPSLLLYELAWRLTKDTNDLLWWAIIGHTELWINKKMDEDRFLVDKGNLGNHVARLNHRAEGETVTVDTMKVVSETELDLVLYRHWSILETIKHTPYIAAEFKAFTLKGEHKISEFLADIGLPLTEPVHPAFSQYGLSVQTKFIENIHGQK